MALDITNQLREGKHQELPAQNIVIKNPTELTILTPFLPIPRNNIISPIEALMRLYEVENFVWDISSATGATLYDRVFSIAPFPTVNSTFAFTSVIKRFIDRVGFDFVKTYVTTSFDLILQIHWSPNPGFQGMLRLFEWRNWDGFGDEVITASLRECSLPFPHVDIIPSEDGNVTVRIPYTLPIGSIPLMTNNFSLSLARPFNKWLLGRITCFVHNRLQTQNPQTSFSLVVRERFENVSFNYLSARANPS